MCATAELGASAQIPAYSGQTWKDLRSALKRTNAHSQIGRRSTRDWRWRWTTEPTR